MQPTTHVGLDVHAESITAAIVASEGPGVEVIELSSDLMKVRRLFRRLSDKGPVRSCYEASGAGFVLQRVLARDGFHCEVIAPSLIPRRPGDHRKTDRPDAIMLARLYRSGHLTPVHVPTEDHEALRRLLRLRYTYHTYCTATMHRISGILRNHGFAFKEGKSTWTKKHRQWLASLRHNIDGPLQTALALELEHLEYLETQQRALDTQLEGLARCDKYRTQTEALCCLRGVKILTALTLLCEVDDVRRFRSPRNVLPVTKSTVDQSPKPATSTSDAFWSRPLGTTAIVLRPTSFSTDVAIALKAQHRLYKKFWHLDQRKHRHVAITAVARELCGFIWAILNQLQPSQH